MPASRWPLIVAEALRSPAAAPIAYRARMQGRSANLPDPTEPVRRAGDAPPFLLPSQIDAWRRVMHALGAWQGCVLAEAVGSGKTWIALGTAKAHGGTAVAIIPAVLREQWRDVAERAGVPLTIWTHEQVSRGNLAPARCRLVIIDEAHRFRNSTTRRYKTIAPWLLGRQVLLLTATPIVNHRRDLIAILELFATDDALCLDAVGSLAALADQPLPPPALRRLVIRTAASSVSVPTRRHAVELAAGPAEMRRSMRAVGAINQLHLSDRAPIRRLIRSVLLDAASSSDAAGHSALRRYRNLLLQARDAGGASRAMLRRFAGADLDQFVLWSLLEPDHVVGELPESDIPLVEARLAELPADDEWIAAVRGHLDGARPSICFARFRATADALRNANDGCAWVSGSRAGIGPFALDRSLVLAAFGPQRAQWRARRALPQLLVASDVAAEGLDLQAAACIIHVDLPWTAVRLAQREGRLLRIGQHHERVDVIMRTPAPPFVAALDAPGRIRRKGAIADAWLAALERPRDPGDVEPQCRNRDRYVVAMEDGLRSGAALACLADSGAWSIRPATPADVAAMSPLECHPDPGGAIRHAVAAVLRHGQRAVGSERLAMRIHRLARAAARRRDGAALHQLDRLLRFATTPTTAGGRMVITDLLAVTDAALLRHGIVETEPSGRAIATCVGVIQG